MKLNKFLAYKLEAVRGRLFIKLLTPITLIPSIIFILPASENIFDTSSIFGFIAIVLAAVNIFGGFLVTQRMLQMYKKKKEKKK